MVVALPPVEHGACHGPCGARERARCSGPTAFRTGSVAPEEFAGAPSGKTLPFARSRVFAPGAGAGALVRVLQLHRGRLCAPGEEPMMIRRTVRTWGLALVAAAVLTAAARAQPETYSATASVKTGGGAAATAPVTITVDRKMPQAEVDKFLAAFKTGGAAALRKALTDVPPTGSIRVGGGAPTRTRLTLERPTDTGRLLTIVADAPILHLGAGTANAKPKAGYDFAIVDLQVDAAGAGSGTFAPAARITVKDGAFVVEDYSGELVTLTGVSRK